MIARGLLLLLVLCVPRVAPADDSPIYESIHDLRLGRVFLSQERRNRLDKRRLEVPRRPASGGVPRGTSTTRKSPPAAGYIVGPNGRSKTWHKGDFIETAPGSARRMSFPGEVNVERHSAATTSSDNADAD